MYNTLCPVVPVRYTWWLPRAIDLLKLPLKSQVLPLRPINEYVFKLGHKETLSLVIFGKIGGPPMKQSIFSMVLGPRTNSATWL